MTKIEDYNPITVLAVLLLLLLVFIIWFWIIAQSSVAPTTAIARLRDETNIVLGEAEWIIQSDNKSSQYYMAINNPVGEIVEGGFYLLSGEEWVLLKSVIFQQRGTSVLWTSSGSWSSGDDEQPLTAMAVDELFQGNMYIRAFADDQVLAGQLQIITTISQT